MFLLYFHSLTCVGLLYFLLYSRFVDSDPDFKKLVSGSDPDLVLTIIVIEGGGQIEP